MSKQRSLVFIIAGAALLALGGLGYFAVVRPLLSTSGAATPTAPSIVVTPPRSLGELAEQYPQYADLLNDPGLDSAYKDFVIAYEQGGYEAALDLAKTRGLLDSQNRVRFTVVLDTDDEAVIASLTQQVEERGGQVVKQAGAQMDIAIPLAVIQHEAESEDPAAAIRGLTGIEHVIRVRLPLPASIKGGPAAASPPSAEVEGVRVTGADAWHAAGLTGQGVKVGVLDLGFDGYRGLLGGALPASVAAESFVPGVPVDASGEVHGAACAEIVHAMAPDAELYLAMFDDDISWLNALDWLLGNGVQVISHSAGWEIGPMDGSGWFAQVVDDVNSQGIVWVNASGNEAERHYRAVFNDSNGDGLHEFPDGEQVMTMEVAEPTLKVILNWDDWQNADQDLDLYVYDKLGNLLGSSEDYQSGQAGGEPLEIVLYYGFTRPTDVFVQIRAAGVTRPVTMDLYATAFMEWPVSDHSLATPADARGSLSVGAVDFFDDQLTEYSSRGPANDGRLKPDISAPTHVSTESYGPQEFDGTSASAPHVAGAAALVWSAHPEFSAAEVKQFLLDNALDLGPGGADNGYGAGRLRLPAPESLAPAEATEIAEQPLPTLAPTATLPPDVPFATQVALQPPVVVRPEAPAPVEPSNALVRLLLPIACLGALLCGSALILVGAVAMVVTGRRSRPAATPVPRPPVSRQPSAATAPVSVGAGPTEYRLRLPDGRRISLAPPQMTVGRTAEAEVYLDATEVSRMHARLNFGAGRWSLTDLGSTNGTLVNGWRLAPHTPRVLNPGDRIRFGGVTGVEAVCEIGG